MLIFYNKPKNNFRGYFFKESLINLNTFNCFPILKIHIIKSSYSYLSIWFPLYCDWQCAHVACCRPVGGLRPHREDAVPGHLQAAWCGSRFVLPAPYARPAPQHEPPWPGPSRDEGPSTVTGSKAIIKDSAFFSLFNSPINVDLLKTIFFAKSLWNYVLFLFFTSSTWFVFKTQSLITPSVSPSVHPSVRPFLCPEDNLKTVQGINLKLHR